jgi:hypothetical protein
MWKPTSKLLSRMRGKKNYYIASLVCGWYKNDIMKAVRRLSMVVTFQRLAPIVLFSRKHLKYQAHNEWNKFYSHF